jgi:hypothetical protein
LYSQKAGVVFRVVEAFSSSTVKAIIARGYYNFAKGARGKFANSEFPD